MTRLIFKGRAAEVSPGPGGYAINIGEREYPVRLLAWEEGLIPFEVAGREGREGRKVSAAVEVPRGGSCRCRRHLAKLGKMTPAGQRE